MHCISALSISEIKARFTFRCFYTDNDFGNECSCFCCCLSQCLTFTLRIFSSVWDFWVLWERTPTFLFIYFFSLNVCARVFSFKRIPQSLWLVCFWQSAMWTLPQVCGPAAGVWTGLQQLALPRLDLAPLNTMFLVRLYLCSDANAEHSQFQQTNNLSASTWASAAFYFGGIRIVDWVFWLLSEEVCGSVDWAIVVVVVRSRWRAGGGVRGQGEQLRDHSEPVLLHQHHQLVQRPAGLRKLLAVGSPATSAGCKVGALAPAEVG